jgi:hypothetical protein
MAKVASHHKWLMKKQFFGFFWTYPMPLPILVAVSVVPFKPVAIL